MEEDVVAAPQPTTKGLVVDNVSIRQAKNGGWIVTCATHQEPPPKNGSGYQSNDYTFDSLAEAVPFIESQFGASAAGSPGAYPQPSSPVRAGV